MPHTSHDTRGVAVRETEPAHRRGVTGHPWEDIVEKTSLRSRYRASLRATLTLLVVLPMMSTAAPNEVRPVAAARPVSDERAAQSGGYTVALASPVPPGASATFVWTLDGRGAFMGRCAWARECW